MRIESIDDFLPYWETIRGRTLRVADRIPAERIDWRYREGTFSFADLLRHLGAIERWMFAENVRGRPSRYPGHGPELADGADAVRGYLDRVHAESVAIFAGLSDDQLAARVETPAGTPITAWKWLRAMVEHEVHHRGQIYTWLGVLEVPTPPLYGLTSEEVCELSVRERD
jgi:uncharacterized damage-inducible protein DinB